jgi:uncharacterized protein
MSNLEILKQGYKAFAAGNVEAAIANWSDNIVWEECIGLPFVKDDGKYIGKTSVVENILAPIPELYDNFKIEISDFVDGGDRIVMVGHYTGTWKATGKKFKANATHTWTFKDGKAIHFIQAVDTATIINP